MSLNTIASRLILGISALLVASTTTIASAEDLLVATPLQGSGITIDVFDDANAPAGTPSTSSKIDFFATGLFTPALQSFKGKNYLFWTQGNDVRHIYYATSATGDTWSQPQTISVNSRQSDLALTVFKQKLVLTFADAQSRLTTLSTQDGVNWSSPRVISTNHTAFSYKPVVYNGQMFIFYNAQNANGAYYLTSEDGQQWSSEHTAFQESSNILASLPVVYQGKLWLYYNFNYQPALVRTYDRSGTWSQRLSTTGLSGDSFIAPTSAAMIDDHLFVSTSSANADTYISSNGLNWERYYTKSGNFIYPSGLGVSHAITSSDLTKNAPQLPSDIATGLSHTDYANFAWRSFIALNNTAATPLPANRGVGNPNGSFADAGKASQTSTPLLWQTYAHRTEMFPSVNKNSAGASTRPFGSAPQYTYVDFPNGAPLAPGASFNHYNNLDEATQIGQNSIFFPNNPPNAAKVGSNYAPNEDSQILFEAKANPVVYHYAQSLNSFPEHIVLPDGALEVKAAWRKLSDIPEAQRSRYHTATVITYEGTDTAPVAHNEEYALVALHIIHKTANYPTFIFATFEHQDSTTLPNGEPSGLYYIANYNTVKYDDGNGPAPVATFSDGQYIRQVTLPKGTVANPNANPPTYSGSHGIPTDQAGPIRVVQPQNINVEVTAVNNQVKQLMNANSEFNNSVWKYYQLKGVQAIPSSDETDPDFYLANIMVESSQPGVQLFRGTNVFPVSDGSLTNKRSVPNIKVPDYNHATQTLNMGGCMGCHGVAQNDLKQGFSFLFDAINPTTLNGAPTGFTNPETKELSEGNAMLIRALKYATDLDVIKQSKITQNN